jgi:hypothetical protein
MTSIVVAILVITLLFPGLAMLFAIVLRYLLRGASHAEPHDSDGAEPPAH